MISLILRLINIILIVALAMIIYKNRGKNNIIVIILFVFSVIVFIVNYIL